MCVCVCVCVCQLLKFILVISDLCTINSCLFEKGCIYFCFMLTNCWLSLAGQTVSVPQCQSFLVFSMRLVLWNEKRLADETNFVRYQLILSL